MRRSHHAILAAFLLATVAVHPAAAQQATPADDGAGAREIEIPGTRIIALSPDGTRLVAEHEADNGPRQLCVYDVATLTEQACGDPDARGIVISLDSVVWSPDSTRIAFAEEAFAYGNDGDLWLMDAASGKLTNLTDDGFAGRIPLLQPDEDLAGTLFHVDILPTWAPDGRSIAFSRSPIIGGSFRGNQVVSIDLASGEVETLVPVTLGPGGVVYRGMAWAPDGQRLYFSVAYADSDNPLNGIWVYDRVSGQVQHVLKNDPEKGPPALVRVAATGQTALIFYPLWLRQAMGTSDYYALLDLETGRVAPVHPVAPDASRPAIVHAATFSPDGTSVLYAQQGAEDEASRLLMRTLPDGPIEAVVADLGISLVPSPVGGGLFWASDGTVFLPTDADAGLLLNVATEPVARQS